MKNVSFDRLKELLRAKLTECGWKDQMKAHCKGKSRHTVVKTHCTYSDLLLLTR